MGKRQIKNLAPGTEYIFRIAPKKGGKRGPWSPPLIYTTPGTAVPSAPTLLTLTTTATAILANWSTTDPDNTRRYDVYCDQNNPPTTFIKTVTGTQARIGALSPNKTYRVGIKAVNYELVSSALSNTITATPGAIDIYDSNTGGAKGFHVDSQGNFSTGGTTATNGTFTCDTSGNIIGKSIVLNPISNSAVPLTIIDTLNTGGNWAEFQTSSFAKRTIINNQGSYWTVGESRAGDSIAMGGKYVALQGDFIINTRVELYFGISGSDTASIYVSGTKELTFDDGASGSIDIKWGGGSGNGFGMIAANDWIDYPKKGGDPGTFPTTAIRLFSKLDGTSKLQLFAMNPAGTVKVITTF